MRINRLLSLSILIIGCKAATVVKTVEPYSENLSDLRPPIENEEQENTSDRPAELSEQVVLKGHINDELDSINTLLIEQNRSRKFWNGYTVQVYSGVKRQDAERALSLAQKEYGDLKPKMSYYQPSYRVKVGQFTDRLEATRAYTEMKRLFPKAIMLQDKIELNLNDDE
ncbi:MAG: SPOR domain-containing protein [Cyclobacteriaceae bacterium]